MKISGNEYCSCGKKATCFVYFSSLNDSYLSIHEIKKHLNGVIDQDLNYEFLCLDCLNLQILFAKFGNESIYDDCRDKKV